MTPGSLQGPHRLFLDLLKPENSMLDSQPGQRDAVQLHALVCCVMQLVAQQCETLLLRTEEGQIIITIIIIIV